MRVWAAAGSTAPALKSSSVSANATGSPSVETEGFRTSVSRAPSP